VTRSSIAPLETSPAFAGRSNLSAIACRSVVETADPHLLTAMLTAEGLSDDRLTAASALRFAPALPVIAIAVSAVAGADLASGSSLLTAVLHSRGRGVAGRVGALTAVLVQPEDQYRCLESGIRAVIRSAAIEGRLEAGIRIGVGAAACLADAHRSWQQACTATRFALPTSGTQYAHPGDAVIGYDELGGLELLAELPPSRLREHRDVAVLDAIAESSSGATDVAALEAFCRTGSLRQAAQALYLHHSTVAARLVRIQTASGWDLNNPEDRFRARFALWARRLSHSAAGH
jgi:sugar diacid utilization regulator